EASIDRFTDGTVNANPPVIVAENVLSEAFIEPLELMVTLGAASVATVVAPSRQLSAGLVADNVPTLPVKDRRNVPVAKNGDGDAPNRKPPVGNASWKNAPL